MRDRRAGFRLNRGCMDNVYIHFIEIVQGRLREDKKTYAFFLDILILFSMMVYGINCGTWE